MTTFMLENPLTLGILANDVSQAGTTTQCASSEGCSGRAIGKTMGSHPRAICWMCAITGHNMVSLQADMPPIEAGAGMQDFLPNEREAWTNVQGVAEHLKVSTSYVNKAVLYSGIPVYRVGRNLRFRLSEVDAWVLSGGAK